MRWNGNRAALNKSSPPSRYLILLTVLFGFGIVIGQGFAEYIPPDIIEQFKIYLTYYTRLQEMQKLTPVSLGVLLLLYFRYPVIVFLMSFSCIHIFLVSILTILYGFSLSLTVSCLILSFGIDGLFLAVALLGIRCLISLPCYFLIAVPASAGKYRLLESFQGSKSGACFSGCRTSYRTRFIFCASILMVGILMEYIVTPLLIRMALRKLF